MGVLSNELQGGRRVSGVRGHRGFTLIELLVVVAIITLLLAILLPSLSRARDRARTGVCLSNIRQICTATNIYLNEWDGSVPTLGTVRDPQGNAWTGYWGCGQFSYSGTTYYDVRYGMLSDYFNRNPRLLCCPSAALAMQLNRGDMSRTVENRLAPPLISYGITEEYLNEPQGMIRATRVSNPSSTVLYGETGTVALNTNVLGQFQGNFATGTLGVTSKYIHYFPTFAGWHDGSGAIAWADGHATLEKAFLNIDASLLDSQHAVPVVMNALKGAKLGYLVGGANMPKTSTELMVLPAAVQDDNFTFFRD